MPGAAASGFTPEFTQFTTSASAHTHTSAASTVRIGSSVSPSWPDSHSSSVYALKLLADAFYRRIFASTVNRRSASGSAMNAETNNPVP